MADTNEFKPRPCHHCGAAHGHFTDCLHKYERAIATAPDLGGLWALCNYFSRMKATPPADAALAVALDCAAMGIRQHNEELADTLNKAAAALRARQEVAVPDGVAKDAMLIYEKALVKLATLGNEPLLGNSSGNVIAQDALAQAAAILAAKENKP